MSSREAVQDAEDSCVGIDELSTIDELSNIFKEVKLNDNEDMNLVQKPKIELRTHIIKRASIQGGVSNEAYITKHLYDSRLTYHIPTYEVMAWKKYKNISTDSRFTDLVYTDSNQNKFYAEGKTINKRTGCNFKPSVNTGGGGRQFNADNLEECFKKNSFYFLYETKEHTDTTLTFHIYWVPIDTVKSWYEKYGSKGIVKYKDIQKCIGDCEVIESFSLQKEG